MEVKIMYLYNSIGYLAQWVVTYGTEVEAVVGSFPTPKQHIGTYAYPSKYILCT